ncbi:sorting nexin-25 isoform X2 [Coccinella septempunctata]|uniref:sorting nexin-25 isoform X2 n=1 Tax=Coccinella septempunctata TaxID=41139 RepID=UPI001D07E9C0|nr:sorting nexin-25 isoform X2 [Coccinella septempunctata]
MSKLFSLGVIVAVSGILIIYPISLISILILIATVSTVAFTAFTVIWVHLALSSTHKTIVGPESLFKNMEQHRNRIMHSYEYDLRHKPSITYVSIAGKTVDSLLKQLLDFFVRDFILYFVDNHAYDAESICENIKEDLWSGAKTLQERLSRVDHIKLIACDIVTKITLHFEKIREAKTLALENRKLPVFALSNHVISFSNEVEFLRNLSELLIMFLLPRSYFLSPSKYLIRECLVFKLFLPLINEITDPDFINRNIIVYIESRKISSNVYVKAFESARTFEDFLKIIRKTDNMDALVSIRYNIVNRIMQATTLQNLNRTKGIDLDNEKASLSIAGISKADLMAAKKLKKYINQLTYAKKECERQLSDIGEGSQYQFTDEKEKVMPLKNILEHIIGRKFLSQFLETLASHDLIRFWSAVEELRTAPRKNWHQLGAEIFYTFIRNSTGEIKVDKSVKKRMEGFLLGDRGPEVFYLVQDMVVQTIEDKYYQPFLISDYYKEMIRALEKEDKAESDSIGSWEERQSIDSITSDTGSNVGEHNIYAKRKLDQLQEKCNNKVQALQALRTTLRPDSKVLGILEKEVEWLQGEKRQLEAHINRTEIWGENLGKWRAVVQSVEVPDEKEPPQFVMVVHMLANDTMEGEESISTGWVVCRSLYQFQELHRKLRTMCSEIRSLELPSNTFKFLFGKTDKASLEKAKQQIQKYLEFILQDDKLNQSEAIYSFLSPSSDHLKHTSSSPKKTRFSFSTLFKSNTEQSRDRNTFLRESDEEDISQCLEILGSTDTADSLKSNGSQKIYDEAKDTIAEPLYSLMSEIFDMRGVFKYLRKTLIAFVQVSYGRSINRQIRDTIDWFLSEQMLHYYVTLVLKNFWPGGTLTDPSPVRSKQEIAETTKKAKELFMNNIPELLTTLVGSTAAKNGANKIFFVLQDKKMNKQIFYVG